MEENDGRRRRRRRGRSRGQAGAQSVRSQAESAAAAAAGQWTVSTAAPNGHRAVSDTLEHKVRRTGRGEAAHRASDGLSAEQDPTCTRNVPFVCERREAAGRKRRSAAQRSAADRHPAAAGPAVRPPLALNRPVTRYNTDITLTVHCCCPYVKRVWGDQGIKTHPECASRVFSPPGRLSRRTPSANLAVYTFACFNTVVHTSTGANRHVSGRSEVFCRVRRIRDSSCSVWF